jgi:hypothetical protein
MHLYSPADKYKMTTLCVQWMTLLSLYAPKTIITFLAASSHIIASEVVSEVRILLVRQIGESIQMPQLLAFGRLVTVITRLRRVQRRLCLLSISTN